MPATIENSLSLSISTTANVHILNNATSMEADVVSVTMKLFARLFPDLQRDVFGSGAGSEKRSHFVLMKFLGVPDFFPRFDIYKLTLIDDNAPSPRSVTISNHAKFAKFGPDLTFTDCIIQSIDPESIPALERIFVTVPGSIYDILNHSPEDSVKERFLSEYIAASGCVVARGDIIRPLNGAISLCDPFFQGRVTNSTNIVFIRKDAEETDSDLRIHENEQHPGLDLSEYLSQNLVFDADTGLATELGIGNIDYELNLLPLPHQISVARLAFDAEDPELYVFTSTRDLAKLGFPVFNGDLVRLCADEKNELLVKVFTFLEPNKSFAPDTLYVSPLLLINLDLTETPRVVLRPYLASAQSLSEAIPLAKSATISRIVSPITMDKTYQRSFFAELKTTFHSQKKCFRVGDMFPVCIDSVLSQALFEFSALSDQAEDAEAQDTEIVPTGNPDAVAWFRVVEISGEAGGLKNDNGQFHIDPSKTSLTSSGVDFVRVPENKHVFWHEYLGMPRLFNYSKAFSKLPGTFKYAQEFSQVIETGIKSSGRTDLRANVLLHSMTRGLGKTNLVRSTALDLGLNLIELDAIDFVKPGAELKLVGLLSGKIEKQLAGQLEVKHSDIHHLLYIKHIEALCAQVDPNEQGASTATSLSLKVVKTLQDLLKKYTNVVLVASSNDVDKVSDNFRQILTFEISVGVPSEAERLEIIDFFLNIETMVSGSEDIPDFFEDKAEFIGRTDFESFRVEIRQDVKSQTLALQSAGLTPLDLLSIVRKTKQSATLRLLQYAQSKSISVEKLIKIGNGGSLLLIPEDFEKAINDARNQFSDSIGAPRIPNVKWEDIGGLDLVKDEILDTIDLPLKHPGLFSNGLKKRSGILFYGPPGTGKTLLAKAIATNFSLNFFSVKGPELLNMYIGESEANVRRVFQKARDAKPCVIFFDELDSVAPKRGNQGDSGGVMDRIVSQLLAELDGMSGGENSGDGVFVVGATNRPDLLDEALLRPGRFDKMLYLGISDTNEKQTKILEALTRKFKLSDEVDLAKIAEKCSFTFTGADFYALCSDSMLNAMTRTANEVDAKLQAFNQARKNEGKEEASSRWWFDNAATAQDVNVLVSMADFEKALSELSPSVSADELAHYLRVKENFEGGKKKVQEAEETGEVGASGSSENTKISGLKDNDRIIVDGN